MISATGFHGSLQIAGRVAATFSRWTLSGGTSWTVEAVALQLDEFWLDNPALTLRLVVGQQLWQWRNVNASRSERGITITGTGDPEVKSA